jgi:hypothetical protein
VAFISTTAAVVAACVAMILPFLAARYGRLMIGAVVTAHQAILTPTPG